MKDFIYVSIPRTGSNTLREVLPNQVANENHKALRLIERDGFSFCFKRHPFDILVSWFFYHKIYQKQEVYNVSFKEWIQQGCPTHWSEEFLKRCGVSHPVMQSDYICNEQGDLIVDFIGDFNQLQRHFDAVCTKIDLPKIELPVKNNVKHESYNYYFNTETKAMVEKQFERDFEILKF